MLKNHKDMIKNYERCVLYEIKNINVCYFNDSNNILKKYNLNSLLTTPATIFIIFLYQDD